MRLVFASKFYYRRGGLEAYMFKAKGLLEARGHTVVPFSTAHPMNVGSDYSGYFVPYYELGGGRPASGLDALAAAANIFYNRRAASAIRRLINDHGADIVQGFGITRHLSASVFMAARSMGAATVMRLSDYALLCPNSLLLRGDGAICEGMDCRARSPFSALRYRCVKGSGPKSLLGSLEAAWYRASGAYARYVDHFIAPSRFIRDLFVRAGFPGDRISWVPVFIDTAGFEPCYEPGGYFLYMGRLDREKGVSTLIRAAHEAGVGLVVCGSGEKQEELGREAAALGARVEFRGQMEMDELKGVIAGARAVAVPSEWYENSPNVVLEAFAMGKPVVASDIGGIPELVPEDAGLLFAPGDAAGLAAALRRLWDGPGLASRMGMRGREFVERELGPDGHYERLMAVYARAMSARTSAGARGVDDAA